ncbi:MAG: hypothetical protein OXF44_00630 [Anaerolineaceae bacterium]|nr:hypothetical protein [Anaerolineaceae bacterium]MCY4022568.1 hypothetical protein [Anaerolineaceae bacterium]
MNIDVAFMLNAHFGLFLLLVVVTIVALLVTLRSLLRSSAGALNRVVMLLYRIVFMLQWLAGLALLIMQSATSGWPLYRLEHALTMTVAVILTHLFGGRRGSRPLTSLIVLLVASALVVVGYLRLEEARAALGAAA